MPSFRRQLRDAAASLDVGSAWDTSSRITPLTQGPGEALRRALTTLDEGEEWLLEPRPVRRASAPLVTGDQARRPRRVLLPSHGVLRPGAGTHACRAAWTRRSTLPTEHPSASRAESRRSTIARSTDWLDRIEAGNLYVNRPITGAMVGRQPFGGWKASSVGPGAKVGGPNYVLQLARWRQETLPPASGDVDCAPPVAALLERWLKETPDDEHAKALLRASAASYALAWRHHFSREHDPMPDPRRAQCVPLPAVPAACSSARRPSSPPDGSRSSRFCWRRSPAAYR